ncbi:MAG: PAS domain S-box protein [Candidatus Thorarchaeota archaeon]|jgi:PAS domain S-box-containing protein
MNDSVDSRLCQDILENAPTLILSADRNGIIQFANRTAFGFSKEEVPGRSIYEFMPEGYLERFRESMNEAITSETPQSFEFEDESESGEVHWVHLQIGPVFLNGTVDSLVLISNTITGQKIAEEQLRDSESKLRGIFNATLEGVILSDESGTIVEWNKAQEDLFGISREEVLGKKLWEVQHQFLSSERRSEFSLGQLKETVLKFFETGDAPWLHQVVEVDTNLINGEKGIIQQFSVPIKTSKGHSLCSFIHDVTEKRKVEQERKIIETRYKALFEENNDAVFILDLEGKHVDCNERALQLLGYEREELIGSSIEITVADSERTRSDVRLRNLLSGENLPIYERTMKRKDGTQIPVEINVSLVRDEEGKPLHIQSIMRNISSRRQVEIALKESEQQWRNLAEKSIQGIAILQESKMVYANPAYARIVGRSIEELYNLDNQGIWNIVHPDDQKLRREGFKQYSETGEVAPSSVYRVIRPNGEVRWIDSGVNVIEFGGKPAMQRTAIDVTNRMLAEQAVSEERDRAEMYLQMAGVIFLALDKEGHVSLFNRKGTEVLGYSQEEILGSSWFNLVAGKDRAQVEESFTRIIQGEIEQIEYVEREHIAKSGQMKLIAWHVSVLRDSDGNINGVISSGEDITEKRAAQMELKTSQEMLQLVMNNIPQHVFWKDLESVYLGGNDIFAEIFFGGTPQDIIGKTDYDLKIDPEKAELFRETDKYVLTSPEKRYEDFEHTVLPNREEAWFRTIKVPLHDASGNEIGVLGTLEDVTEKHNAELELIESESKFRTLMHSMQDLVFVFDENNIYREVYSQDVEDLYVPPREFIGQHIKDILPHDVSIPFADCMDRVRESGISEPFDYLLPDDSGNRWFSASISLHEDGKSVVSVIREITSRIEAVQDLEEAYNIINLSPVVAFLQSVDPNDQENRIVEFVTGNSKDQFGYTAEDFKSDSARYRDLIHPDDRERVKDETRGFSADRLCESYTHEPYRIVTKSGEVRWVADFTALRRNEDGDITHRQIVITDITNRILIEEVLRESEIKYRTIIEQSLMGIVIIDSAERTIVLANPLIAQYLGFSVEELLSLNMSDLIQIISPEDLEKGTMFLEKCIRGEEVQEITLRLNLQDGEKYWILLDGSSVSFEGRNAVQLSVVDITERMEAQEHLERERLSFRSIAESAIHAKTTSEMGQLILQSLITALNFESGTLRLYNERENSLQPTAYVGLPDYISGVDAPCTPEGEKRFIVSKIARLKQPFIVTDSSSDPRVQEYNQFLEKLNLASFVVYPLINEKEELLGTFTFGASKPDAVSESDKIFFDTVAELLTTVVERKKTEQAYQMSERRYRELLTDMSEGIGIVNLDEEFIFVNESFAEVLGFNQDELVGMNSLGLIHDEDRGIITSETDRRREGVSSTYQIRIKRKDGDLRTVRVSAVPSRDVEGNVEGTVAIINDITERVRAEREVRQLNEELSQRVEERTAELQAVNKELEAFAYSVSHDLRAPLRSIDGFSNAVIEDYYDAIDDTGKDYLDRIRNGAKGMSNLIDAILSLSKVTRANMDRVDVNLSTLSEEVIIELKGSDPEREVIVDIQDNMVMRCDKRLMRIVLQNLIGNSWKFTQSNPLPRIDVGIVDSEGEQVFYVKDNGVGFEMDDKEKLFKPFQRLHKADEFEGSGIGLATVQRAIARHGGRIWAESREGTGTTFFFTLKMVPEEA